MRPGFIVATLLSLFLVNTASAAEIRVLSAVALAEPLRELGPQFERSTGHKLTMQFGPPVALKALVESGETFDLVILTPAFVDQLAKQGKINADTRMDIARDGLGVAVHAGAPKPDVTSVEAFKHAMLNAKSIVINAGGAAGPAYFNAVFRRLGIAQDVEPKIKSQPTPQDTLKAIANGDGELGFVIVSMIKNAERIELAGPLPSELQNYLTFTGAVASGAREADGARALLKFLASDTAATVIKAKGLQPAVR